MTDATGSPNWTDWIGADVVDADGAKIGKLTDVYTDNATGQPEWLTVKTGLFGGNDSFVPIAGATAEGDALRVPFAKALVKDAPRVGDEAAELNPDEEARLYAHYGRDAGTWDASDSVGDDDAMTRSEEELVAGTRRKAVSRARLRKYIVTENVTMTVPVRKEVVRLEYEPIADGEQVEAGELYDGPPLEGNQTEMILSEEEVVVDKRVVPKERVRLEKITVVDQETVTDEVRKERIDVEGDVPPDRTP